MCGRYYIDDETSLEIKRILNDIDKRFQRKEIKTGEIYPTNMAPILVANKSAIEPTILKWGAAGFDKNRQIINARSESVHEKRMFRESIIYRRCIVPANGFYEWNRLGNKTKYYFTDMNCDTIYMAGIYDNYQGMDSFIILTTSANDSMREIHDRMPLILYKEQVESWLFDEKQTDNLLRLTPPYLHREELSKAANKEFEQLTFDFLKNE